jgi:hypothetical protein
MKRRIAAVTILLICTGIAVPAKADINSAKPPASYNFKYNNIKFEEISAENVPAPLSGIIASDKARTGFLHYYDEDTGYMYIAVLMGKRNTGGYSVQVTEVEDVEGRTNVWIKENKPQPGTNVLQVITYPYTVIRAKGITPNITIKNSSGTMYGDLTYDNDIDINELQDTNFYNIDARTDIEENKSWTISFNKEISIEDLGSATIYVRDSEGKRVSVSLALLGNKKQVLVKPEESYRTKESYYLFIKKAPFRMPLDIGDMKGYRMKFTIK